MRRDYAAIAAAYCSFSGEYVGSTVVRRNCQPIPGSVPQQYSYTMSYQCIRPQPCRY